MNDEQRQKIKAIRLQGLGYKRISDAIGLTRDSVRGYCRRNGLDEYGKERGRKLIVNHMFFIVSIAGKSLSL